MVKEEVVESCIIDDGDMEIQMTLASPTNYTHTTLPQVGGSNAMRGEIGINARVCR